MAKQILLINRFAGGIADSEKEGISGSFQSSQSVNIFGDPAQLRVLPASVKRSGATVTGLIKWIVPGTPYDTNIYFYDADGKIYRETSGGAWSALQTTSSSVGQGLEVHNNYLYYTRNTTIGRYGLLDGTPTFSDSWQTGLNDTSASGFAPIKAFKEGLAVGHGNNLGWWDGSAWTLAKLALPPGHNIRTLEVIDELLAIGTWRSASAGGAITDNEEGYVFFWDGTSTTFNFFVKCEEGGCNALVNSKNKLLGVFGSAGNLYTVDTSNITKIRQFPNISDTEVMEIYPGALSNWRGITRIGAAASTTSTTIKQGIYAYGSKSSNYPDVLSYEHILSTLTITGTTVAIGAVKGKGNSLYYSWKDASTYGVDRVNVSNDRYATGTFESLLFDAGIAMKDKEAHLIKASHLALAAGTSIQLGYKINRATNYTTGTANSTTNSNETLLSLPAGSRFREFQSEVILGATGTTTPTLTGLLFLYDDLLQEESIT